MSLDTRRYVWRYMHWAQWVAMFAFIIALLLITRSAPGV